MDEGGDLLAAGADQGDGAVGRPGDVHRAAGRVDVADSVDPVGELEGLVVERRGEAVSEAGSAARLQLDDEFGRSRPAQPRPEQAHDDADGYEDGSDRRHHVQPGRAQPVVGVGGQAGQEQERANGGRDEDGSLHQTRRPAEVVQASQRRGPGRAGRPLPPEPPAPGRWPRARSAFAVIATTSRGPPAVSAASACPPNVATYAPAMAAAAPADHGRPAGKLTTKCASTASQSPSARKPTVHRTSASAHWRSPPRRAKPAAASSIAERRQRLRPSVRSEAATSVQETRQIDGDATAADARILANPADGESGQDSAAGRVNTGSMEGRRARGRRATAADITRAARSPPRRTDATWR